MCAPEPSCCPIGGADFCRCRLTSGRSAVAFISWLRGRSDFHFQTANRHPGLWLLKVSAWLRVPTEEPGVSRAPRQHPGSPGSDQGGPRRRPCPPQYCMELSERIPEGSGLLCSQLGMKPCFRTPSPCGVLADWLGSVLQPPSPDTSGSQDRSRQPCGRAEGTWQRQSPSPQQGFSGAFSPDRNGAT